VAEVRAEPAPGVRRVAVAEGVAVRQGDLIAVVDAP
jgi:acetyl/propionyl-CoA carboxylase alpha subunit